MNRKETEALLAEKRKQIETLHQEMGRIGVAFLAENKPFEVGTICEYNGRQFRIAGYSYGFEPNVLINPMKQNGKPSRLVRYLRGVDWDDLKEKLTVIGFAED